MKLEVGKYYKTRDGYKAVIYNLNSRHPNYPVHGAILHTDMWNQENFTSEGRHVSMEESGFDLISEWKDAPVVDWSKLPSNANFVAMDEDRIAYFFNNIPEKKEKYWLARRHFFPCPPGAYSFSGDWKDSLVVKPE